MGRPLAVDFVGDISCPWCALGLAAVLKARDAVKAEFAIELTLHPFELDSTMSEAGEVTEALLHKRYGRTPEETRQGHAEITAKGRALGLTFNFTPKSRTWNTFAAHRLLQWAKTQGKMLELSRALYAAHFADNQNISDRKVLAKIAKSVGLKEGDAKKVIERDQFADEVRAEQRFYAERNVHGVPAVILDQKWIHQGAEGPEFYAEMFRKAVASREPAA